MHGMGCSGGNVRWKQRANGPIGIDHRSRTRRFDIRKGSLFLSRWHHEIGARHDCHAVEQLLRVTSSSVGPIEVEGGREHIIGRILAIDGSSRHAQASLSAAAAHAELVAYDRLRPSVL